MKTRIYAIEAKHADGFFLVEAATKSTALRHVAEQAYKIQVADQRTLVEAIRAGIQIDNAVAEPEEALAE